jgi:hypothetical protein
MAGGSVPTTAVAANFPGDAFGFTGSDGLLLNSQALDNFLQTLSSTVGTSVDVNTALSQSRNLPRSPFLDQCCLIYLSRVIPILFF